MLHVVRRPLAGLVALAVLFVSTPAKPAVRARARVSGSLVFWDQERGIRAIEAHAETFTEISPFWYFVADDGRVEPYRTAAGRTYEDSAILAFLRSRGILVVPTVANIVDGEWHGARVGRLLADPARRTAHVEDLVRLASAREYDGIDIDYEDLTAADRQAFSAFVAELAAALHARGKLLTVNLYAKTAEPGTWAGPMAQDYAAIGRAADEVRLMTYEFHWATSAAGPIAPVSWVRDVLAFATSVIPPDKILQGLPLYGYDWVGQNGTPYVWSQVEAVARQHRVTASWDYDSASPWFDYWSGSDRHTVWFENALSVEAKLDLAARAGVGGVMLWRLAGEDPAVWPPLRSFAAAAPLAARATH